MLIKTLTLGALSTNCYIVADEDSRLCAVVDPADEYEVIRQTLEQSGLKLSTILLTHSHYDHMGALTQLAEVSGAPIYVGEADKAGLSEPSLNLSGMLCGKPMSFTGNVIPVKDGSTLQVGDIKITVLETPGHTPGSVCYLAGNNAFCGDTVFRGGIGRTDFPGGSESAIYDSLKCILSLDEDFLLFPGHGAATTVALERTNNPYYHI